MAESSKRGSVRIGPISVFVLVIILCLAVLAVLSITTAHASQSLTTRQLVFTADQYANESAGQEFMGLIDKELVKVRQGSESADQARANLTAQASEMAQQAATHTKDFSITGSSSMTGNVVAATFTTASGHLLSIRVEVYDNGTYQITQWKQITQWNEAGNPIKLWSGTGNK